MTDVPDKIIVTPSCLAITLCELVIIDQRTNNKSLIGCFNAILVTNLPAVYPRMFVMASLTGMRGTMDLAISIKNHENDEILRLSAEVKSNDPLVVNDFVVEILNLPLEASGEHYVDLIFGGTHLAGRRFFVNEIRQE